MPELGLFPLGIVLLPSERVPLHVFEERYKELIDECIAPDEEFGLLYADESGLREIGCRATVVEVIERFDDGRLNVLVEGRERFRILRHTGGRSFSTAEVDPVSAVVSSGAAHLAVMMLRSWSVRVCVCVFIAGSPRFPCVL